MARFRAGNEPTAGYSFADVLTHTTGRLGVGPRANVGFQFRNLEWRRHGMGSAHRLANHADDRGSRNFTWSISWGPHFSDTSDFRYWIAKPGFVWQQESRCRSPISRTPFCDLSYNDATPNANPDLVPTGERHLPHAARFRRVVAGVSMRVGPHAHVRTFAAASTRSSRHTAAHRTANIVLNPNVTTFTGSSSIALNGSASVGSGLAPRGVARPIGAVHHHESDERAGDAQSQCARPPKTSR